MVIFVLLKNVIVFRPFFTIIVAWNEVGIFAVIKPFWHHNKDAFEKPVCDFSHVFCLTQIEQMN
jgi:hypothetical protein